MSEIFKRLTVRDYREDDYEKVMLLWEETGLGGRVRGDNAAVLGETLRLGGKLLVGELNDGTIVGTSWMTFDGRRIHLHHVGVLPAYQRQGIGRLLSVESIRFAKEKNVQIKLEVHRENIAAIALYRSLGFHYLGDYDVYIIRDYASVNV
ncbi:MAG: GNAT family N-acetyltransferase [Bacteroidia bacterium]|nr:MAG: GNAT family N-acetyltransferase [Bacteroidia bacterium]